MNGISKPLLRGWSHAIGAVAAVVGVIVLGIASHGDSVKFVAVLVYGISLVVLLGFSATYHIPHWSPARREFLRRIDHANIFILIAGTYTPVVAVLLTGAWRMVMLLSIWGIAIAGVAAATPVIRARRRLLVVIYVAMGCLGVVAFPQLIASVGAAILLLVFGGVLYSAGALAYATRRPRLWPRVFGYHEVFHLAVVAASALFYIFVLTVVMPYQGS